MSPFCRELQWLVSTCWNRGCHHATFERHDQAVGFMEVALQLLKFSPELQDRQVWAALLPVFLLSLGMECGPVQHLVESSVVCVTTRSLNAFDDWDPSTLGAPSAGKHGGHPGGKAEGNHWAQDARPHQHWQAILCKCSASPLERQIFTAAPAAASSASDSRWAGQCCH